MDLAIKTIVTAIVLVVISVVFYYDDDTLDKMGAGVRTGVQQGEHASRNQ